MPENLKIISVIGDASLTNPEQILQAQLLGAALMEAGFGLVTGGMGGVMEAVSQGAQQSAHWQFGRIIGIVPSYQKSQANAYCDIVIPSGMQMARNILVVSTGDVVVALGGGAGTLSEIALAWQMGKPIITLGDHGWAGKLAGQALDQRHQHNIRACNHVGEVIALCLELAQKIKIIGDIGQGIQG